LPTDKPPVPGGKLPTSPQQSHLPAPTNEPRKPTKPGTAARLLSLVGITPPGYNRDAAKSAARRYPKALKGALKPRSDEPIAIDPQALERMKSANLAAMWLGHASVLLHLDGRWVLTDPVFSHRVGISAGPITLGVPRLSPAIDPSTLPPIDLILLSHAHFDHLDRPTLRALRNKNTQVITSLNTRSLIPRGFASIRETHWQNQLDLDGINLLAIKPNHWGARTMWDKHRGFNSYLLRAGDNTALFAGDTADSRGYAGLGPLDLSIFGIGAYDPWIHAHASPEQVWQMHTEAGGAYLLPMHHSTFELSDEPVDEPLRRLLDAAGDQATRVIGRELGAPWTKQ